MLGSTFRADGETNKRTSVAGKGFCGRKGGQWVVAAWVAVEPTRAGQRESHMGKQRRERVKDDPSLYTCADVFIA